VLLAKRCMPLILAGLCACGLLRETRPSWADSSGPIEIEADRIWYDGDTLRFRVLLGAMDGGIVIDRHLVENVHVTADTATDCVTGKEVGFWSVDHIASSPREGDLLFLGPGDWFGTELEYPLFMHEHEDGGGPPCVQVKLTVQPEPSSSISAIPRGIRTAAQLTPGDTNGPVPGPFRHRMTHMSAAAMASWGACGAPRQRRGPFFVLEP